MEVLQAWARRNTSLMGVSEAPLNFMFMNIGQKLCLLILCLFQKPKSTDYWYCCYEEKFLSQFG